MRRLQQILTGESALADVLARRQRESKVEERVKRALPPMLAARVTVIDARFAELVLAANSGAAAALLRQRLPDIGRALAHEGWEFTGIKVRVQARPAFEKPVNTPRKQLDPSSIEQLKRLAAKLGSNNELSAALSRLASQAMPASGDVDQALDGVEDQDREQ